MCSRPPKPPKPEPPRPTAPAPEQRTKKVVSSVRRKRRPNDPGAGLKGRQARGGGSSSLQLQLDRSGTDPNLNI